MRDWHFIAKLEQGGHRLFAIGSKGGRVAIADNSGRTPDDTDDGALFLDPDREMEVKLTDSGRVYVNVPVLSSQEREFWVMTGLASIPQWIDLGYRLRLTGDLAQAFTLRN